MAAGVRGGADRPAEGHRQPRRRTGCTPENPRSSHALQNDTLRPEPAPAGMLQGLPIAAERRAVGWGEMGRGAGEGVATSTAAISLRRARARGRGAACADLLPDTFPPLPVNGCRSGREPGSLRLPGWALSSSGWGRALKRAATPSAGSRAAWSRASGKERLVPHRSSNAKLAPTAACGSL